MEEEYKGFQIEINKVPDIQFERDGFGWAYQVFNGLELFFRVVIKATSGSDDSDNVQSSYSWGITKISSMIEINNFEKGKIYCYLWYSVSHPPREVHCEGFLWNGE